MEFPESLNPDKYQKLSEKLSMDADDYDILEFVRRHMRYIISEENTKKEEDNPPKI